MKLSAPIFRLKRQARLLSREAQIPLHQALDQVAREEGFEAAAIVWEMVSVAEKQHEKRYVELARDLWWCSTWNIDS